MNTLVTEQGDDITQIETNVATAKEQVQDGTQNLVKAEEYQKKARKKMCYVLCCLLIFVGVIFAFLGGFGVFKSSWN